MPVGERTRGSEVSCAWCGRRFVPGSGPGRPRRFCRRSCRQRDYEARQRIRTEGLADDELVVTRQALSRIDDLVYVLACAVEDVERDLATVHVDEDIARALSWLMEAAKPLADASRKGLVARPV